MEHRHLFMSVYPYEAPLVVLNVDNDNGFGGSSIIYRKENQIKIPGKGGCLEQTITDFMICINEKLLESLAKSSKLKCKVAALLFIDFNSDHLEFCETVEDALAMEGLIYELAQETQTKHLCKLPCDRPIFSSRVNFYSTRVLSKELALYGDGYYIIWMFFSTLYVNQKVETFLFDFDTALVAVGGSLGLFLGWSLHSMVMAIIEFIYYKCKQVAVMKKPTTSSSSVTYVSPK